jgi:hypothetical protein
MISRGVKTGFPAKRLCTIIQAHYALPNALLAEVATYSISSRIYGPPKVVHTNVWYPALSAEKS